MKLRVRQVGTETEGKTTDNVTGSETTDTETEGETGWY